MDDTDFRKLLDHLGYSWAGYRKVRKGVKKRIRRHMQRLGCWDIAAYMDLLEQRADSRTDCEMLMTVPISRFFRDRALWQTLEKRLLPDLIARNRIRLDVWSAGCACGEEVYSFKIVWELLKNRFEFLPQLRILATDRDPERIEKARNGIYNPSSLREVTPEVLSGFFETRKGARQFLIKEGLKGDIEWATGDLQSDPPEAIFHVILLRNNILTYLGQEGQISTLIPILNRLAPGGLFISGCHEALPLEIEELVPMVDCPFVYQKK
jgi:chemotaxis methyl-accepting protein methylase